MKRSNSRLSLPEGSERVLDSCAGVHGSNTQREGSCPSLAASSPTRACVINDIHKPKKAALQGEGGPGPRLLNIRQLSDYLAMPVATIYTWVCLRRVPAACIVRLGRSLRFDREAVDRWIEERRIGPP